MATVAELLPGDLVKQAGMSGVFIATTQHPIWPSLMLVIWRMPDGSWSHDALLAAQEVGEVAVQTSDERARLLRYCLLGEDGNG